LNRFEARAILHRGRVIETLRDANELFCERSHRNTSKTHISRVGIPELLDWFLGINDHDWMELPETGHICINRPAQLKKEVEQFAAAENLPQGLGNRPAFRGCSRRTIPRQSRSGERP
jgi:hypothetical protein